MNEPLGAVDLDPDRLDQEPPEDDLEELYRVADEIAEEGGYVRVYRRDDRGKPRYLTRWGADAFDLEDLRKQFGGGSFQIRFHDGEGKYHLQKTVYIEGPPKTPKPEEEDEDEKEDPAVGALMEKVAELAGELSEMRRDLQRNAGDFNRSGADPATMLLNMMQVVSEANKPLMQAVLERAREKESDPDSAVDRLLEGIQLGRELGGGPSMPPWERAAQRLLPALKDLAGRGDAPGPAPAPGPTPNPNPNPDAQGMTPPYRWYPLLAPHLRKLVQLADAGKDPELRAWVFLEDIPEAYYPTVYEELSRSGFRDELYTIQGLPERRVWLDMFLDSILEELGEHVPDGSEAPGAVQVHDPAGGPGDVGDAGDDGGGGEEGDG